ncbi:hypothetical protein CC1G_02699 [Coprinopsis cinerea okayama7|uniref:Signal peptidase complex subunit 1 n=1 Tax=Coprinopsis cinerea (strain Okayama-7 / 130 / ATCC MYA-4618 / FGSC 9003) TaxID=240176 RepID=A8PBP6_COPC7|nr:hypothetical protein CC1G_02699 [Coprinopsis cinerea okayama7\|eukprot:XP_001840236.1 hypothetical protein CC1G_02699 [Coprinopsis cinerea okayama7\
MSNALTDLVEARIDFVGQNLVEQIARVVLIAGAVISFIAGFALQSLSVTFGVYGAIVAVLALVILPAWPMFNKNPVKWLPSSETSEKKTAVAGS